jgi:hypothetical protein
MLNLPTNAGGASNEMTKEIGARNDYLGVILEDALEQIIQFIYQEVTLVLLLMYMAPLGLTIPLPQRNTSSEFIFNGRTKHIHTLT